MGSRSDNGGWPSDGGSPDDLPDLPDLPAEWGTVVIPDDLSELADEVEAIRAELRRAAPQTGWQRFNDRLGVHRIRRIAAAAVRAPVLIISLAVLVTLASLFASAWPGPARTPAVQRTANNTERSGGLPALELVGSDGRNVSLRNELPAVILVTDGCDCARLVSDTVKAVSPDIAVVTVVSGTAASSSAGLIPATGPAPQPQGKTVRALRDPPGALRASLHLGALDGTAAAVLVNRAGDIIRTVPRTVSVEDIRPDLARL